MKRCKCGSCEFDVTLKAMAFVTSSETNIIKILHFDNIHPVAKITGEIYCTCGERYEKWDDIPNAPE